MPETIMRKFFFCSFMMSLAGANLAVAQTPPVSPYGLISEHRPVHGKVQAELTEIEDQVKPTSSSAAIVDDNCTVRPATVVALRQAGGPSSRFWANAEYLLWWTKGDHLPPLVTTGPANAPLPGALGALGTTTLFGGNVGNNNDPVSGGRFALGLWLDCTQACGFETEYFFLGNHSNNFTATSTGAAGTIVLARPFTDAISGLPNVQFVAFPGVAGGTISVTSDSRFQSIGGNFLFDLCSILPQSRGATSDNCHGAANGYRVNVIGGFRYFDLRERLRIDETRQVLANAPALVGNSIVAFDQFDTSNQFFGGQLGVRAEVWWDRWFVNAAGKIGLGDNRQTVDITGSTSVTAPGAGAAVRSGSLLALPSNIGHRTRDQFTVVPELNINVGYQLTHNLRLFAGYTFLDWNQVVRPGTVIDTVVNPTRTPLV